MKTLYKHSFVGLMLTIVMLLQTTGTSFARTTEKKQFHSYLLIHKKKNKPSGIEMKGCIQSDVGTINDATITVFVHGVEFLSTTSNHSGKCKFILPLDQRYTIVISTPGYRTKTIVMNAEVPTTEKSLTTFHFTIDMSEDKKDVAVQR